MSVPEDHSLSLRNARNETSATASWTAIVRRSALNRSRNHCFVHGRSPSTTSTKRATATIPEYARPRRDAPAAMPATPTAMCSTACNRFIPTRTRTRSRESPRTPTAVRKSPSLVANLSCRVCVSSLITRTMYAGSMTPSAVDPNSHAVDRNVVFPLDFGCGGMRESVEDARLARGMSEARRERRERLGRERGA